MSKRPQNESELLDNETKEENPVIEAEEIPEIETEEYTPRFCKKCKCELISTSKHFLCENCRSEIIDGVKKGGKILIGLGGVILLGVFGKDKLPFDNDD